MLSPLHQVAPKTFSNYIEPFFGGGALFFSLNPSRALIADSNPELVNLYTSVRDNVAKVLRFLEPFENDEDLFYQVRALDYTNLEPEHAAARTIFLNRTCFNGLYRVNKSGGFNVPFGRYKNPNIFPKENLIAASAALQNARILLGDYKDILRENAEPNDFIFLDPPYLPVSEYADFKRYTKEQFYEEDQVELAEEVERLHKMGCHVVLTNSNHPLVHDLYDKYEIKVHKTKRNISSKAKTRTGEDVIVVAKPYKKIFLREVPKPTSGQTLLYPSTRYMGSKEKLIPYIQDVLSNFEFDSALDLFSGSGVVGYLMKSLGKKVITNDYMAMSSTFSKAMIENNGRKLSAEKLDQLFERQNNTDCFVEDTFSGLYYTDEENRVIDTVRWNAKQITNPYERSIAMSALIRACLKKRARGIFTYTGLRYDDGRADLKMSMEDQIRNATKLINGAVFSNGQKNRSLNSDAMSIRTKADLVYLDPPYFSPLSDNEYVRRYHFVEGLAKGWSEVDMQWHTKTKKFKSYPTPFSSRSGAYDAFNKLFYKFRDSIILVSYSSNSLPSREEMLSLLAKHKRQVDVIDIDYRYSFANQGNKGSNIKNEVKEYLFIGY